MLSDVLSDFWEVRAGCLLRHHVVPRRSTIDVTAFKDAPVDPACLDPIRITVMKQPDGQIEVLNDDGTERRTSKTAWTGTTVFQINGEARKELCMFSCHYAKKMGREVKTQMMRQQRKKDKKSVSERDLTVHERALFQAAKCKELQSFFEHDVWTFDTTANAIPERTLSARLLLTWSKNPDGSPRAKCRLIVRGYNDVDALQGNLDTSSPTTSRLSRNFLLSMTSTLEWLLWTADISTAFLQGLPQERKLWIKLPAECHKLLGCGPETRMLLKKPCYGQLDAPRRWFLEACRRLRGLGLRQHVLDPCTFLILEKDFGVTEFSPGAIGECGLVGIICLHVDDLLGAGDGSSPTYQKIIHALKDTFTFREWHDGESLSYCGADIQRDANGIKLHHTKYLQKIKPVTVSKGVGHEAELSSREISNLRGLMGSLQWPAVQSSPHLQASTSMLSGEATKGLVGTAVEANRLLKFAKENSDVGLCFAPLGPLEQLRMITAFDASFCSRSDGSSQGGYFVMLANNSVLESGEGPYHILDWKSFRLPRVARSSLSAEAQAAGCASDATEFACRYFEHLRFPDWSLAELLQAKSVLNPVMITDAKALYDSYHRESLISNVTDRRSSLEIRVVKEQIGSLGGSMRWVSSDRQLADGLTKSSMRQTLADKLRHAKIKFLYDPGYVAAKKKTWEERQKELESSTKTRTYSKNVKKSKNDIMPEINETPENDLTPADENMMAELYADEEFKMNEEHDIAQNAPAPVNVFFAQSSAVVKYVNARRASHGAIVNVPTVFQKYVFKTLVFLAVLLGLENVPLAQSTDVCITPGFSADGTGSNNYRNWFGLLMILVLAILALLCCTALRRSRRRIGELETLLDETRRQTALLVTERDAAMRNSNVMTVMHVELQNAFDRRTEAYNRARRLFVEQREAARQYQDALRLTAGEMQFGFEAAQTLEAHFERCPLGYMISIQDGSRFWHTDADCPQLYDSGLNIQNRVPCPFCAARDLVEVAADEHDPNAGVRIVHAPPDVNADMLRGRAGGHDQ